MPVSQLIYYSRNMTSGGDRVLLEHLRGILKVSQANNLHDAITGYLIFDKTWFVQILEGDETKVTATYHRIQRDPRHGEVTLMSNRAARNRSFPKWSMGGSMRSLDQREIFLQHGVGDQLDPTRIAAPTVVALAMDLQDHEIAQQRSFKAAS